MPVAIIAPSMLASDFANLQAEATMVTREGADWLHMDVMDGRAVPNITMGQPVITSLRKHIDTFMDLHMMVYEPERWVEDFAKAGGDLYCFHIEFAKDPISLTQKIHKNGMKVGIAIKPDTPSSAITEAIVKGRDGQAGVDMVLVMSVEPGFGGQKFMPQCMPKVTELRKRFPDLDIEVDGGLDEATIGQAADAGANVIVAGSSIFKSSSKAELIRKFRETVNTAQQVKKWNSTGSH